MQATVYISTLSFVFSSLYYPVHVQWLSHKCFNDTLCVIFRTVSITQLGTGVNTAKKVSMETHLRGHAECAHAHSVHPQTGV